LNAAALVVGGLRMASGVHFLATPEAANRMWGDAATPDTTTRILLRSMGYRDDFVGSLSVHNEMTRSQQVMGIGGAAVGIAVGLWGATRKS
jgi:hypothetical protein